MLFKTFLRAIFEILCQMNPSYKNYLLLLGYFVSPRILKFVMTENLKNEEKNPEIFNS